MSVPGQGIRCQSFHKLFGMFDADYAKTTAEFQSFLASADHSTIQGALQALEQHKTQFLESFRQTVVDVMREWYGEGNEQFDPDAFIIEPESGRVVLNRDLRMEFDNGDFPHFKLQVAYFPTIIRKVQDLYISGVPGLTNLDHLEEVDDDLTTHGIEVSSMKRLKRVGGYLNPGQAIQSLPSLEYVNSLGFSGDEISLPRLREVEQLSLVRSDKQPKIKVRDLSALEYVHGDLALHYCDFTDSPSLKIKRIGGSAAIYNPTNLAVMNELEYVGTQLVITNVDGNTITELPNLRELGNLGGRFDTSKIERLDRLEKSGSLRLPPTFQSAKMLRVSTNHITFPEGGALTEFPELTEVGGTFFAPKLKTLRSLPKLHRVGQTLDLGPCDLEEIPNLEAIGFKCKMDKTVVRLPKVRQIEGALKVMFDPEKDQPTDFEHYFPSVTEISTDPMKWGVVDPDDIEEGVISNNPKFIESVKAQVASGKLKVVDGDIVYQPDAA